jgi:hypothetical protein
LDQLVGCWEHLKDPRTSNAALHDFHELLMIGLCGGQTAVDMALFAAAKAPFLRGFLKLAAGLPSHDTFCRLFRPPDLTPPSASAPSVASLVAQRYRARVEANPFALQGRMDASSSTARALVMSSMQLAHRLRGPNGTLLRRRNSPSGTPATR